MKRIKLASLLLCILLPTMLSAQIPTITSALQIPGVGDSVHYETANSFGFNPAGSGGCGECYLGLQHTLQHRANRLLV